ncbi:MAG: Rrf2 family transcriptional regulator [Anaerolineaceae bacterium]|nr:Rrf2 family transcriptional regulator [Anaerolineaceae bacterium]
MQITRQADYALRAVIYLSRLRENEKAATSSIAADQKISPSFLAKIVSQLSIAGLITTSRGAHGGISLARQPDEISILDVIEAIDGPVFLNECTSDSNSCPFLDSCPLKETWRNVQDELIKKLSNATFSRTK